MIEIISPELQLLIIPGIICVFVAIIFQLVMQKPILKKPMAILSIIFIVYLLYYLNLLVLEQKKIISELVPNPRGENKNKSDSSTDTLTLNKKKIDSNIIDDENPKLTDVSHEKTKESFAEEYTEKPNNKSKKKFIENHGVEKEVKWQKKKEVAYKPPDGSYKKLNVDYRPPEDQNRTETLLVPKIVHGIPISKSSVGEIYNRLTINGTSRYFETHKYVVTFSNYDNICCFDIVGEKKNTFFGNSLSKDYLWEFNNNNTTYYVIGKGEIFYLKGYKLYHVGYLSTYNGIGRDDY